MTQGELVRVLDWLDTLGPGELMLVVEAAEQRIAAKATSAKQRRAARTYEILAALQEDKPSVVAARFNVSRQYCYQLLREEGMEPYTATSEPGR